jgi:hypothetical protein
VPADVAESLGLGDIRAAIAGAPVATSTADGLLGEDVLARVHRRRKLLGAKARGRGEDHEVTVGGQHLLVRIEAGEALVGVTL